MVLNKKGGVEEKRGFHWIHRRLEGQIRLEIEKNQQGLGLACHSRRGYRAPLHPSFRITFLNLGPVPTAGRALPRPQWIPPGPAQERSQVLSAHRAPRFIQVTIPNLGSWPWVGWGDRMQPLSKEASFLSGFLSDSLSSHSQILWDCCSDLVLESDQDSSLSFK